MITRRQRLMAARLREELIQNRLVVVKSRDGSYHRIVESENPDWYRDFCAKHPSNRKDAHLWREFKTKIHRPSTLRALAHLEKGRMVSWYTEQLLAIVDQQLMKERANLISHVSDVCAPVPF